MKVLRLQRRFNPFTKPYQTFFSHIMETDEDATKSFLDAARAGEIDVVSELVSIAHKNGTDNVERFLACRDQLSGNTALHLASANGHIDIVTFLLDNGSPINSTNESGSTALHYAALTGQLHVVRALLSAGALAVVENNFGRTALDEAQGACQSSVADYLMGFVENNSTIKDLE